MSQRDASPPRPDDPEPEDLTTMHVRAAIAGEAESLEWVVARLSPLLLAHASHRLGDLRQRCDPADLVSEAWVVTLPKLASLPSRSGRYTPVLLGFLTTTIVHRVYALVKRHVRERDRIDVERDWLAELPADASGVVSRALRSERHDAIREALAELEDSDREIVLLRGVEQLTSAVVGVQVGLSTDAVAKRYQRALAKLRARLPGSVFEELEPE